jgi:hypothetical protein
MKSLLTKYNLQTNVFMLWPLLHLLFPTNPYAVILQIYKFETVKKYMCITAIIPISSFFLSPYPSPHRYQFLWWIGKVIPVLN